MKNCDSTVTKEVMPKLRSPLRYPGGKGRLVGYIEEFLTLNELNPKLFVEPFAGGASVSLNLLSRGVVDRIALGEKDPLVAAFWNTVFNDVDWLIDKIESTPITLDVWKKLKKTSGSKDRDRAFACLFLNRTSFSGILHPSGGPIGGKKQSSEYKIDCRFPINRIIRDIRTINALSPKVEFINAAGWKNTMEKAGAIKGYRVKDIFFYIDPPFFLKADRLYPFFFKENNHKRLCEYLSEIDSPWLVSYDYSDEIRKMYSNNGFSAKTIDVLYSTTSDGNRKSKEIIISNQTKTPSRTKMWSSSPKK